MEYRKMITGSGLTVSEIENLIEEWIFSERDRFILKILRADELMDAGYSGDMRRYPSSYRAGTSYDRGTSYDDRGRGSRAQRDSRGRYSSGRGYSRYVRDDYSMAADEVVEDLTELMEQAPNEMMRKEIQKIKKKVEEMDD